MPILILAKLIPGRFLAALHSFWRISIKAAFKLT